LIFEKAWYPLALLMGGCLASCNCVL